MSISSNALLKTGWASLALVCIAAGCRSAPGYSVHRPGGYSGVQWVATGGSSALPPYPDAAKQAGVSGDVTFAAVLVEPGLVDRRTLTVLAVSDPRILEFACPWIGQAQFSPVNNKVEAHESGMTAIAIRYSPDSSTGRLVDPGEDAWSTVQTIKSDSAVAAYRRLQPQCH